jgi:hypothetical protein
MGQYSRVTLEPPIAPLTHTLTVKPTWRRDAIARAVAVAAAACSLVNVGSASAEAAIRAGEIGAPRVEGVFAHHGFTVFPPSVRFGPYEIVTGFRPGATWPLVDILVFRASFQAARLFAYHRSHPAVPLVTHADHPGRTDALLKRNLIIVWPKKASPQFVAAVKAATREL